MTDITELVLDHGVEEGFYAWEDDTLKFAANFIQFPNGTTIQRSERDTYSYPVNGYYWFNTKQAALSFFNKSDPDVDTSLPSKSSLMTNGTSSKLIGSLEGTDEYDKVLYEPDGVEPTMDLAYDPGEVLDEADDVEPNPTSGPVSPHA